MQAKVDGMTTCEPKEPLDGGLCPKSKGASQEEINNETDQIAYDIGDIGYCPEKQQVVNAIVQGRGETTNYAKTEELSELITMKELA